MIANLVSLATVYIYIGYLIKGIFVSFLCSKVNLILGKIINRVEFVYLFKLNYCDLNR